MSKITFPFKGLMAPVFTGVRNTNDQTTICTDTIEKYAAFLKSKSIHGVLVNGTTGEGPALSVNDRKVVTEKWTEACKKHQLTLMVQVGGAPIQDVTELARHAQSLKVNAILCLPELYFKPKTTKQLVSYLKSIASNCPEIPFLYYHIPAFTGINFDMPTFCDLAEASIPNFVGLKYTSADLDQGQSCLKPGRNVFLGADTILSAALVLGFDSAIMTTLNIYPELAIEIMKCIAQNRISDARKIQNELTHKVREILHNGGGEWVPSMKAAFNRLCSEDLNVGQFIFQ